VPVVKTISLQKKRIFRVGGERRWRKKVEYTAGSRWMPAMNVSFRCPIVMKVNRTTASLGNEGK
jgi:hypothetical protein